MFTPQNNAIMNNALQMTFTFIMLYNYILFRFHPFERSKPSVYYSNIIKENAM